MKSLSNSLTASIFSLGQSGYSAAEAALPPDALVIVIQDRVGLMAPPLLLQFPHFQHSKSESLPVARRKAEKAYAGQLPADAPVINLSG